ncbi:ethanolamine kinase 1 [Eurytemora carolleeae]|uniref:ethanolamine kinase 1 n=1 Tax=Eurytemora carolleeae TaxID=1294199 RepID=UPI000C788014|nr:ethanolamine kinase 1 [Eurytemora carolleeae]|eukprot:XP_023329995.1 ethanolamine kinase 1-like [Eurytemora affinis]
MADPLTIDVTVDLNTDESLKKGARLVLQRIRPDWVGDDIDWKVFTDGITNKLIGAWFRDKQDTVLVRVYGIGTEKIIDRKTEVENMRKLDAINAGSKLYAIFNNGIAYEFIHGSTLTKESVKNPAVYPLVARMTAKLHHIPIQSGECKLWSMLRNFIELCPQQLASKEKQEQMEKYCFSQAELFTEYNMLKGKIVVFIDMEYAGPSLAAFDIANHFVEFVGCGGELDFINDVPGRELQEDWIREYLTEFNRIANSSPPTNSEIVAMYDLVQVFMLCSNLLWSSWSLIQAKNSNIDFDFVDYAIQRQREYRRKKGLLGL